ncbi:hypothetical protein ACFIQG_21465 [Comamonas odontotermitis]|uniref:hypothetical protein n=1 Tax=Comamonas odontotermitis TaxID=379895 RepID=UPI0036733CE6
MSGEVRNLPNHEDAIARMVKQNRIGGFGEPPHNGDMEARITALEEAVKNLPTKTDFAELRADMAEGREAVHKLLLENSRWTHTALISMLSVAVIGILGLLFTIWNATKPASVSTSAPAIVQPSQSPPIIINVPGPATNPAQEK